MKFGRYCFTSENRIARSERRLLFVTTIPVNFDLLRLGIIYTGRAPNMRQSICNGALRWKISIRRPFPTAHLWTFAAMSRLIDLVEAYHQPVMGGPVGSGSTRNPGGWKVGGSALKAANIRSLRRAVPMDRIPHGNSIRWSPYQ